MDDIVTSVQLVADIIKGTADASQEQSAGIEQVNQAVGQMDEITQQNAALVEQAAAAAESLQDQAAKLADLVDTFKLTQTGRSVARAHREPSKPGAMAAHRPESSHSKGGNVLSVAASRAPRRAMAAGGKDEWEAF